MPSEYRAIWTVPGGGTGYTVLHAQDVLSTGGATDFATNVRALFNALASLIPDEVQVNFDSEVINLNTSGTLTGVFPVTPPLEVDGTSTGTYNRAAGFRIDWNTDQIVAGHRLTGRSYFVPATSGVFDNEGQITGTSLTTIQNAANAYISAMTADSVDAVVWSRTHAVVHDVTTASVPSSGAILRSRRD